MKKEFKFTYHQFDSFEELNENQQKVMLQAEKAQENAYSPYSKFNVGAALLLENGTIILGNNQENKAYPSGLCAERVALFAYGSQNLDSKISILAVTGDGEILETGDNFSPCGGCRQVMAEYTDRQNQPFEILLKNSDGSFSSFEGIHHLLPFVFGKKD